MEATDDQVVHSYTELCACCGGAAEAGGRRTANILHERREPARARHALRAPFRFLASLMPLLAFPIDSLHVVYVNGVAIS